MLRISSLLSPSHWTLVVRSWSYAVRKARASGGCATAAPLSKNTASATYFSIEPGTGLSYSTPVGFFGSISGGH